MYILEILYSMYVFLYLSGLLALLSILILTIDLKKKTSDGLLLSYCYTHLVGLLSIDIIHLKSLEKTLNNSES